jgi:glycosyltransferase involved in cell wall biosynthesis
MRALKKIKRGIFVQTIPTTVPNWRDIGRFVSGDVIVLQSDHSLGRLKRETGARNLVRIYPGVDTEKFKPGMPTDKARSRLNLAFSDIVVFYGGSYYLEGWETLRDAILSACKAERRIKFILACRLVFAEDIVKKTRIQAAAEREGFKDRVVFLDSVENIAELLALSDIGIFPPTKMWGKSEIPMILLEALAMEKPIVISDIPPLNEIMKDNVGEVVPPGNPEALARAIETLSRDKKLRTEKGVRGRKMVLREFNMDNTAKKYRELYDELLSRRR